MSIQDVDEKTVIINITENGRAVFGEGRYRMKVKLKPFKPEKRKYKKIPNKRTIQSQISADIRRKKIIDIFRKSRYPITVYYIERCLIKEGYVHKERNVVRNLKELCKQGVIKKVSWGEYELSGQEGKKEIIEGIKKRL
jgi:hypothetical protein